ncbi:MAG TPA: hypothetical protein VHZ24_07185 [Pirellulales bacterium]|nr:hypothetical protein [Pirellulales bacterium]
MPAAPAAPTFASSQTAEPAPAARTHQSPASIDPWADAPFGASSEASAGHDGGSSDHVAWPKLLSPPPPHSEEQWTPPVDEVQSTTARILVPVFFLSLLAAAGIAAWQYQWIIEQVQLLIEQWF